MNVDRRWIVIPNWEKFQHYKDRRPPWIKNYTTLLRKPEYLDLPLSDRGLLHGIWLAYADSDGRLRRHDINGLISDTEQSKRTPDALRMFVCRSVDRLNHAGLVDLSASAPLSLNTKNTDTPNTGPTSADLRAAAEAYTRHDNGPAKVDVDQATLERARAWIEANSRAHT